MNARGARLPCTSHTHCLSVTGPHLCAFMATRPCRTALPCMGNRRGRPIAINSVAFYDVSTATGDTSFPFRAHRITSKAVQLPAHTNARAEALEPLLRGGGTLACSSDTPRSPQSPRPVWGSPALVAPAFARRIHGVSPSISFALPW